MISLHTAKILLFLALALGPKAPQTIYATSNSDSYVWTSTATGWAVESKRFPSSDFTRSHIMEEEIAGTPARKDVPEFLRAVSTHDWSHNSTMIFANGDRVEKHGDHAFYIINAGAPNQQIYTILYPTDD